MPRTLALAALAAFLIMLGLGVLFPVLPFFARELGLSEIEYGLLLAAYPAVGIVVSPFWGRFSDRRGRRPAIAIGLTGFGVGFVLFGLSSSFETLLGARLLGGLFSAAALPAVFAYAADVTRPDQRTAAMGAIGAAIGLGVCLGPAMGGLLSPLGLRVPYFASGGIGLGAALFLWLWLPESLTEERRAEAARRRAEPDAGTWRSARRLAPFLGVSFLTSSARLGIDVTLGWLIADRLGGTALDVGLLLGAIGLWVVLIQGGAIRPLSRRVADRSLLVSGCALLAGGLAWTAGAASWTAFAGAGLVAGTGFALATPSFNALLSRAAEGVQGDAQGLNASAQSLSRVAAPLLFAGLYAGSSSAPLLLAASLGAVAALWVAAGALRAGQAAADPASASG